MKSIFLFIMIKNKNKKNVVIIFDNSVNVNHLKNLNVY